MLERKERCGCAGKGLERQSLLMDKHVTWGALNMGLCPEEQAGTLPGSSQTVTVLAYQAKGFGFHPVDNRQPKQKGIFVSLLKNTFPDNKSNYEEIWGNVHKDKKEKIYKHTCKLLLTFLYLLLHSDIVFQK